MKLNSNSEAQILANLMIYILLLHEYIVYVNLSYHNLYKGRLIKSNNINNSIYHRIH